MTRPTFAEQSAEFVTTTFKDGEPSDGTPTAEEAAATASDQASAAAATAAQEEDDEGGEGQESGEAEGAEGAEGTAEAAEGGDDNAETPEAKAEKAKGKGKPSFNERIGDLTAARRQAERDAATARSEAEQLRAEIAALKSGKVPLTVAVSDDNGGDAPPDPSKFDYGELDPKYIAALARHETAQALKAAKADDDKVRQADAAAATQREQATKQDALVKAGIKLHDDFDTVVMQGAQEGKWQLSQTLGELLLDSEFGPQIAYELAKDPDEASRVFKLPPAQQAAFLGRQEAKFEAAKTSQGKTPKVPQAQTPPKTPRGGSGSNKVGADSSDFAAVEAAFRSGQLR